MHTTLAIDEDVLAAAEELADFHQQSLGEVISSLARQSLDSDCPPRVIKNGIRLSSVQPMNEYGVDDRGKEISDQER